MKQLSLFVKLFAVAAVVVLTGSCSEQPEGGERENTPKFAIVFAPMDNGTAVASVNGVEMAEAAEGDVITIHATPDAGYGFAGWSATPETLLFASATSRTTTFTMPAGEVTLTAALSSAIFDISFDVENGTIKAFVDGEETTQAQEGDEVTVTATSEGDYRFAGWRADPNVVFAAPMASTTTFTMPAANITVTADFNAVVSYYIGVNSSVQSRVTVTVLVGGREASKAAAGDEVTITAEEKPGYEFGFWRIFDAQRGSSLDAIVTDGYANTTTFLMPQCPVLVDCQVQKNAYYVTVSNDGNGYALVGFTENRSAFYWGNEVTLTPIANAGYKFKEWTEPVGLELSEADRKASPLRFVMPINEVSMKATFEAL